MTNELKHNTNGGDAAKSNRLEVVGNMQTMNFHNILYQNVLNSPYFKGLFEKKTYHEVVDEIYNEEPFFKGNNVSTAFCLLYKLWTLRLTIKQVNGLITHTDSPYIRALGFLYLRYVCKPANLWAWYEPYLDDDEEVQCSGTMLPRIPVPIAREIEKKLKENPPKNAPVPVPEPASPVPYVSYTVSLLAAVPVACAADTMAEVTTIITAEKVMMTTTTGAVTQTGVGDMTIAHEVMMTVEEVTMIVVVIAGVKEITEAVIIMMSVVVTMIGVGVGTGDGTLEALAENVVAGGVAVVLVGTGMSGTGIDGGVMIGGGAGALVGHMGTGLTETVITVRAAHGAEGTVMPKSEYRASWESPRG
ncbi:PRP38 pre-mRNA processing factor 38 domain-containing protein B [Borealophlyctis nickersoniae]|nr:PRP38 pre-mRNA processing factor 38 domain-containing protein B [Borealophlyctis nickersoniae]